MIDEFDSPGERVQKRIDLIVETAPLRMGLDPRDLRRVEDVAGQHYRMGLMYISNGLRKRSGLPTHEEPRGKTGRKSNRIVLQEAVDQALDIIRESGQIRPCDLATAMERSRSYMDRVTSHMRKNGLIILVRKKYYQLPDGELEPDPS